LSEARLEIGVRHLFEAETEVGRLIYALNEELLQGLREVFLPEILHGVGRPLWQDALVVHLAPELIGVLLDVFLIRDDLIEFYALDDGVLLLLADIKFAGILIKVLCDEISIGGQALPLLDAVIEPARRVDSPVEIVGEANFHAVRLDLVGEALMLVNHQASVFPDFLIEVIIG
jgi:hypothetical protein